MKPATVQHTPTPWRLDNEGKTVVGADGIQICTPHGLRNPQPSANAAFIVRAVNCHEELLAALKADHYQLTEHQTTHEDCASCEAIAKAEGRASGETK